MEELADTEDLDRTRIVIVGDSLVGKSSMLNAFLTRNELTIITRERKPTNVHTFDVRGTIDGVRHHMLLVEIGDDDANEKCENISRMRDSFLSDCNRTEEMPRNCSKRAST
ncbi:uncharacterized protein LOC143469049 isoform X3 [Clavelina lepadiformis]|uniref:uncharacterized protein LOC143469049 isoform X3 n=1 Tax=Clavelina lepadiformis TaxID=159417 RepID=UPI0040416206